MIAGIFHAGSGLGNQLHRYVATRCLALDKGYEFSMVTPENFKGSSFMDLDMGHNAQFLIHTEMPAGKVVVDSSKSWDRWQENTPYYNPEFNFIGDNTIIDGEFQSIQYFGHRLAEIDEWLKVEPIDIPDYVCVINFRGGEYSLFPELFLPKEYWDKGIEMMKERGISEFEVHTDDPTLAKQFFPNYKIVHDIGINWRSLRCAKHAIIANTSFAILPRLLKHTDKWYDYDDNGSITIAPRYWARHNTKEWSRPDNYYKSFQYI